MGKRRSKPVNPATLMIEGDERDALRDQTVELTAQRRKRVRIGIVPPEEDDSAWTELVEQRACVTVQSGTGDANHEKLTKGVLDVHRTHSSRDRGEWQREKPHWTSERKVCYLHARGHFLRVKPNRDTP